MFLHNTSGRPAWLLEQTQDGEAVYTLDPPGDERRRTTRPAPEFFTSHTEAVPADEDAPKPPKVQRQPMQQKPAKAKPPAKAKATAKAKAKETPPAGGASPQAKTPAGGQAAESASTPPGRAGGEPHGESGTQQK